MSNCLILRNVSLIESVQNYLYEYDSSSNEISSGHKTKCGIFSNSKYVWYAKGPKFEVVETRTGRRITSWTFGSILRDTTTKVNCLAEIPCFTKDLPLIILGLECSLTGGIICVFDILTSKVLRAIQVNDKVSYVHVVDCGSNIFQILGPLRAFDGVVAVGLAGGDVLLVDLCQQCIDDVRSSISAEDIKDEMDPCQLMSLTIKDINEIEHHKQIAAASGDHLAIYLNAVLNSKSPHFTLKGPKGDDRAHVNKVEVIVTSIFYCSQLGSLLVGYNFGAWQIWDIINMVLIYTSPIYEGNIPVSHFTVQEPADDPRAFCYIWAVYSHAEQDNVGLPFAVLYSLSYETKDFHEGYGYLYQNLQSCAVRFQIELSSICSTLNTRGACCLRLTSYNKGLSNRQSMHDSHEDLLTICYMVWNVWHVNRTDTYISIFDLNQWYKAQMPSVPQGKSSTYLSFICVSDLLNGINNYSQLLDAYVDQSSITQFLGIQKPEEHYYPTSLSYEFSTCSDSSITFVYNKGHQRALLSYFDSTGPLILSKPMDVFQQAIKLGLTPLYTEMIDSDLNLQREFLMNVALENQMTAFLCKCASTWSNGSFACIGCSLEFFLKWSWNRVITLKTNADKLCEPLFDYSGASLDANNQKLLNNCITQLSNLHSIYKFMCRKIGLFEVAAALIQQQENSLHMIVVYLEVLQWLVNIGLLPEFSESTKRVNKLDETGIPYPIDSLLDYYKERRSFLQSLDPSNVTRKKPLLYIDHLIENKIGVALQKFWEDDGGNGFYPPPSLQSLLRTYLIENVDLLHKHSLVIYVFLDLAMSLDQSRYKFVITHLIKFPSVFRIETSLIKTIQAFWQLDHGEFSNALEQLSDPIINTPDLDVWHHRVILNALLLQGQHNFALLYFQIRKPPIENTDDIIKVLSMYVLNHLIDEAITFARQYSSKDNDHELLVHVFKECEKTKQIPKLLYYPLTPKEEDIFMRFLKDISFSQLEEFQVSYYLNRSRYLDIFKMDSGNNDKIKPSGLGAQNNANYRSTIMKTIQQCKVTKHIMDVYRCERGSLRSEVSRPQPMSVMVHSAKQQPISKSSLIRTGIMKAKEIWTHPILESSLNQELPFIGTPSVTPSVSRKRPSIICSKLITSDTSKTIEEYASPQKRMRMSPRKSLVNNDSQLSTSEINASGVLSAARLLTPIVRRKTSRQSDSYKPFSDKLNTYTPQSILKVGSRTTTPSRNLDNIQEKHKNDDIPVQKNVTLISPKGRSSYKHTSLSNQTLSELESDPDTTNTEPTPAKATHVVKEKYEETPISRAPLSTRKISHSTREEIVDPMTTPKTQLQSPPILSPRRTTRSMRGKSEEPMPSPTMESESSLLPSPRRRSRSARGKSEEPVAYPTVQSESPLLLSPRRSSRFTRGKSEEPLPSSNIQSDSFISRKTSRITRGKSEETRPSSSSSSSDQSDLPLPQSPRRLSRTIKATSEESSSATKVEIQSTIPLSPRRPSFRVSSRKSLSRRVLENNAFSMGISQNVIQPDHIEASNTQALEGDVYTVNTDDVVARENQKAIEIFIEDTLVADTEKTDVDMKNNVDIEEGVSRPCPAIVIHTEEEKEDSEKVDTVPIRRRSSFKLKSRKSLSRMVLENNAFSLHKADNNSSTSIQASNESNLLEQSARERGFSVSGMSSLESVDFNRILGQQKFIDIPDFSLSPTRYDSSSSIEASREACNVDDHVENEAESIMEDHDENQTEGPLPKSPDTFEIEKENTKPVIEERRRNSIKSRRSIDRSEYNLTSMSTSTPFHSKLLEKSEGGPAPNVSGTSSSDSEKMYRVLCQKKFIDIPDFSLSPTRYDSSISIAASRETSNVDDHVENEAESIMEDHDENQTEVITEDPLPKSPDTFEIEKENTKPVIEQRRRNSIKSRRSVDRSEYNLTSMSTSTPFHSKLPEKSEGEPASNVSGTSSLDSEEIIRILRQKKFIDIPDFSLSPTRYDSSISVAASRETSNVDDHVENEAESIMEDLIPKSPGTLEIEKEQEDPVDTSIKSHTPDEETETNQLQADVDELEPKEETVSKEEEQVTSFITTEIPEEQETPEQLVEENEKDIEISSDVIELSCDATEMHRELTNDLSEEIDELNQAQVISSDVIEIGDTSSSNSERTLDSTSDGSNISNVSTFVDERSDGNDTNENSGSDDVSNEVCDTSDEFYDANNAILELDTEYIGEDDVEDENEPVSQEINDEEEANASTEEEIEEMEVEHVELDRSDSEHESVQILKTFEQDSNKEENDVDEEQPVPELDIAFCEENYTEEVNTELERLDETEHEEQPIPQAHIDFCEEQNTEKVNTVLERLDETEHEIVDQENVPLNITALTEEDIDRNSKYTEIEDNVHEEQHDGTVKTDVHRLDESEHDITVEQENGPLNIVVLTEEDIDGNSKYTELEDNFHEAQRDTTVKTLDNQQSLHKEDDEEEINPDLQTLEVQEDQSNIILVSEHQNQVDTELLPGLDEKEQSREINHSVIRPDDSVLVESDKSDGMNAALEEIGPERKIGEENPTSIKDTLSKIDDLPDKQADVSTMLESAQLRITENIEAVVKESPHIKADDAEEVNESQFDFDNMTIEPSTGGEITLTDIFDLNGIDKTAYMDVTVTDILEQSFPEHCDNSTITEHETRPHSEKINKERESSQSNETLEPIRDLKKKSAKNTETEKLEKAEQDEKQTSESNAASPDSHYSMHLRKRSSSSTSFKSTIKRTPRKRSASVEETSTKPKILASTPSTSAVSPARRSKRTASVSSLPVILEEPKKSNKKGKARQLVVEIKKQEKQVVDDIESYSTSRRLTRNQEKLLQRSKARSTGKQMNERPIETEAKEDTSITDDPDLSSSPPAVSESVTSARVMTRRMSQESTSSKVSKSSRTTRKSDTGDDDDRSSVSLRRSSRHRSKTPDIDIIVKTSGNAKKHLSKIAEEIDDDIKEEPPKKRGKSKK